MDPQIQYQKYIGDVRRWVEQNTLSLDITPALCALAYWQKTRKIHSLEKAIFDKACALYDDCCMDVDPVQLTPDERTYLTQLFNGKRTLDYTKLEVYQFMTKMLEEYKILPPEEFFAAQFQMR